MDKKRITTLVLSLFIAFVFVQSLFFKFAGAAEPLHIFGTLDRWAEDSFGLGGVLFSDGGIFSRFVIGGAELVASILLLGAFALKKPAIQALAGLMSTAIMSGAIFFHLFTPLGIVIENQETGVESDGGTLFIMACIVWLSGLVIAFLHKDHLPIVGKA